MPNEHSVAEGLTLQQRHDVARVCLECHCIGQRVAVIFQAGEQRLEYARTALAEVWIHEVLSQRMWMRM